MSRQRLVMTFRGLKSHEIFSSALGMKELISSVLPFNSNAVHRLRKSAESIRLHPWSAIRIRDKQKNLGMVDMSPNT